jgi:hypothetical protein
MRGSAAASSVLDDVVPLYFRIRNREKKKNLLALRGEFTEYQWVGDHIIDGVAYITHEHQL